MLFSYRPELPIKSAIFFAINNIIYKAKNNDKLKGKGYDNESGF